MSYPLIKKLGLKIDNLRDLFKDRASPAIVDVIEAKDLEKLLESAPVVKSVDGVTKDGFGWHNRTIDQPTHSARLIMVEEIEKKEECVEHMPNYNKTTDTIFCQKCKAKLIYKWEIAK